jgi:hypothetical protein
VRHRFVFALGFAGLICQAAAAWAQDSTQIYVTPRLWYSFITTSETPTFGASVEHTPVPLYGATIAVVPKNMGGTTFSITGFYGSGNGDYQEGDGSGTLFKGRTDLTRLDIEGVAQFPIGTAGAYWSLGLRYVKADTEATGTDQFARPFKWKTEGSYYFGELGIGGSTPLNAAATHRFFGGLTLLAGQRNEEFRDVCCTTFSASGSDRTAVAGVDTNFGYAASLGSNTTFYARYRLFVLSEMAQLGSPDSMTIVHGPEVNLSFKLN